MTQPSSDIYVHLCHARPLCDKPVDPKYFACREHWALLPRSMQRAIWAGYAASRRAGRIVDTHLAAMRAGTEYLHKLILARQKAQAGGDSTDSA